MSKTQVAERRPTEVQEMPDFGEDAGLGKEGTRADELQTPFLAIAQSNSKILKRGDAAFSPEARPGDLYNTVTREVYNGDEGVEIMPCFRESLYTLWTPIDQGGGFHGTRSIDDPEIAELIKEQGKFPAERVRRGFDKMLLNSDGQQIVEQVNLYLIYGFPNIEEDNFGHAVVAFKSTNLSAYRSFFTTYTSIRYGVKEPPMWAHRWKLTTITAGDSVQSWFNPRLVMADGATVKNPFPALVPKTASQYQAARAFYFMLKEGKGQANYASAADTEVAAGGTDAPF